MHSIKYWMSFIVDCILLYLILWSLCLWFRVHYQLREDKERQEERQGKVATSDLLIAANFTGAVSPPLIIFSNGDKLVLPFLFVLSMQFLFANGIIIQKYPSLTAFFLHHWFFSDLLIGRLPALTARRGAPDKLLRESARVTKMDQEVEKSSQGQG